jgi:eukaryotic-like serine/threonine-protein kinase
MIPHATSLGRYEILGRIATGGMATIYLARVRGIHGFEKHVVVKQILPALAQDRSFVERFLEEARLAATLQHGNIVQVLDVGSEGESYFFTMEFLNGVDLATLAKTAWAEEGGLPLEHVVSIGLGVCAGLQYAHDKTGPDGTPLGIVHRDISPQNLFATLDGMVKVLDFGIARTTARLADTAHGVIRGKVRYMSPEQSLGGPLDRRSDLFSLAVVLWELATGARLFVGQNELEILALIASQDAPPPSWVRGEFPRDLEAVIMKGLRRNPDERYATAEEFRTALERFAREHVLDIAPITFERYLRGLFAPKLEAPPALTGFSEKLTPAQAVTIALSAAAPRYEVAEPRDEAAVPRDEVAAPHDEVIPTTASLAAAQGPRPVSSDMAAAPESESVARDPAEQTVDLRARNAPTPPAPALTPASPPTAAPTSGRRAMARWAASAVVLALALVGVAAVISRGRARETRLRAAPPMAVSPRPAAADALPSRPEITAPQPSTQTAVRSPEGGHLQPGVLPSAMPAPRALSNPPSASLAPGPARGAAHERGRVPRRTLEGKPGPARPTTRAPSRDLDIDSLVPP